MKQLILLLPFLVLWGCGGGGSDDSPPAPTATATISISWGMSSSATVDENTNGATLIDATLNNSTAKLSFSLSGTDSDKFSISNEYLVFVATPDYENPSDLNTDNSYSLTITATGAGISSSHSISINVTNVNEAPSLITDSSVYFQVNENSTAVKQIVASDPESDTLVYSLQDSSEAEDENLLQINSATGDVTFKSAPNYESPTDIDANNTLIFTVVASDGSFSISKKYYVAVVDVKENPTDISLSSLSVFENSAGSNFGTISLVDEDPVGVKTIVMSGSDAVNFEIGPSLSIKFKPTISGDFETKASYSLTLTITDMDNITLSKTFTLNILDANDAPTSVSITGGSAAENSAGANFGTLTTTDQDVSDTFTYTVTGGTDAASFEIGSNNILKFKSTVSGNFETKSSYSVIITSTDSGSASASSTLSLSLLDVNESPTDIALSGGSAAENSAGASFGTLSTTDPDAGDTFTYTVTGGTDGSSFEIGSNNILKFKSTVAANFESKSSYSVIVTSTDAGSNTYAETLTVTITNVNEAPAFTTSSTASAAENGTAVLTAAASDPESGSLTYSLGSGNDTTKFSITSAGVLTFNRAPDYEIPSDSDENNTYLVNLIVSDGSFSTTLTLTVTVTDVNEPTALTVPENIQTVETQE
jgi:hypothetical protein